MLTSARKRELREMATDTVGRDGTLRHLHSEIILELLDELDRLDALLTRRIHEKERGA
jgi:hypothetical protein